MRFGDGGELEAFKYSFICDSETNIPVQEVYKEEEWKVGKEYFVEC